VVDAGVWGRAFDSARGLISSGDPVPGRRLERGGPV